MRIDTTHIYTDASYNETVNPNRVAIAMVCRTFDSISEHVAIIDGVSTVTAAEMLAAIWAYEHAIAHQLRATVFTDCASTSRVWFYPELLVTYPGDYLAKLVEANRQTIALQKIKRGESVFNRRADHLAGTLLNGYPRVDIGTFLSDPNIHIATRNTKALAAKKSVSVGALDVSVAARVKVVTR